MWKARIASVALLTVAGALLAPTAASAATPDNVLVSARSGTGALGGGPANGRADRPQISGSGRYVTFDSAATNLDPRDTTKDIDVYRRDLQTGATELVSVGTAACPEGTTGQAAICNTYSWPSDDGNLVAFTSDKGITTATVPGRRVYVRNMTTGTSQMVSVTSDEKTANGSSSRPMMSGNGRYVAFASRATNLSPLGGNGTDLVYLRDLVDGTTTLVSTDKDGGLPDGSVGSGDAAESYRGMVSNDGNTVAYSSQAGDIVPGDTNNREDVFVKHMDTGVTERVSVRSNGTDALGGGARPYMTPDGRYVLFNTYDPIVPEDTNGRSDVYMVDLTTPTPHKVTWISKSNNGTANSGDSLRGFLSDDGRYAVYNSFANNLVDKDFNGGRGDAFIRDMATGKNYLLSLSSTGGGANGQSFRPVPSSDGSVVTFLSIARNLVAGDTSDPSQYQVYAVRTESLFAAPDTTAPSLTVGSPAANATLTNPVTFSGTVSDDRAVRNVDVGIRRGTSTTGYEWLQADGSWAATAYRGAATVDTTAGTWSMTLWASLPDGSYSSQTRAFDTSGNTTSKWVGFKVATPSTDAAPPTVTVTSPAPKASVSNPVTFTGTATDDRGVAKVGVAIRRGTTEWLQADGTWVANVQYRFPATLGTPGGTATGWTLTLPRTLADGSYGASTTAWDTSNKQPTTKPWTPFTVVTP